MFRISRSRLALLIGFLLMTLVSQSPLQACFYRCDLACSVRQVQTLELEIQTLRLKLAENPLQEDRWEALFRAESHRLGALQAVAIEWRKLHWEEVNAWENERVLDSVFEEWRRINPQSHRAVCLRSKAIPDWEEKMAFLEPYLHDQPENPFFSQCMFLSIFEREGKEQALAWKEDLVAQGVLDASIHEDFFLGGKTPSRASRLRLCSMRL